LSESDRFAQEQSRWIGGRSAGATVDPADRVTLDESINMAFLVVLDSMTPAERVALILHDVFQYAFAEVAEITLIAQQDGSTITVYAFDVAGDWITRIWAVRNPEKPPSLDGVRRELAAARSSVDPALTRHGRQPTVERVRRKVLPLPPRWSRTLI
jgi:ATP-dependent Clp protease adapter protein ClpS